MNYYNLARTMVNTTLENSHGEPKNGGLVQMIFRISISGGFRFHVNFPGGKSSINNHL